MLCERLGVPSPRHLLRVITSRELSEWLVYYELKAERKDEAEAAARAQIAAQDMARQMTMGRR